jgi:hypothetical protein
MEQEKKNKTNFPIHLELLSDPPPLIEREKSWIKRRKQQYKLIEASMG